MLNLDSRDPRRDQREKMGFREALVFTRSCGYYGCGRTGGKLVDPLEFVPLWLDQTFWQFMGDGLPPVWGGQVPTSQQGGR